MLELVQQLAATNPFLLAFSVLIFDIPRYTLSLASLALFGVLGPRDRVPARNTSVSVILPAFNGAAGLERSIVSLRQQTLRPTEIIVVDDGVAVLRFHQPCLKDMSAGTSSRPVPPRDWGSE
jgi:hypothetical protein